MIIAEKLKANDEIRVVAPAQSLAIIASENRDYANSVFEKFNLKLSFSHYVNEVDEFGSSSVKHRLDDLHEAFADKKVKAIFTVLGGYNSNQLLDYLDYDLIRKNPKIFCGYSDITALLNAIYTKTGLITYYGPHYSTFGVKEKNYYTLEYFFKCLFNNDKFEISASDIWSDDQWYLDQNNRHFIKNDGFKVINEGTAMGTIIGGNLCTFSLLTGTTYLPNFQNTLLFLEDDDWPLQLSAHEFDRNLQALLHLPQFKQVKAIIIGRFQKKSAIDFMKLQKIIRSKSELNNIPVICGVDFGHTLPMITFPIGGLASIEAVNNKAIVKILTH